MRATTGFFLALALLSVSGVQGGCRNDNWWGTFDRGDSWSKCSNTGSEYIHGFMRNNRQSPDEIYLLEEAVCCTATSPYAGDRTQIYNADWWHSFDRDNSWNNCPPGFFLQGLYRTGGSRLGNIEDGRCMKPASHPYHYGHCYDHDITLPFDSLGTVQCNANYFVTGLFRSMCDELYCIEKMRCCQMAPRSPVNSLSAAKTKVMDDTMSNMALLAHYLGYGWCGGCRSPYVGEDFRRHGDTWAADTRGPCSGYMSDRRLSMNYGNWKFSLKNITFGQPVLQELRPETIDTGVLTNRFSSEGTQVIRRDSHVTRTVTHTVTSDWRRSNELGVTFGYQPGLLGGISGGASYNFHYETSSSTTDSTGHEQTNTLSVEESILVPAFSAVNWTLALSKARRTVPYSAKILVHFSTELQGFLRWGGGPGGRSTNYHYQHRGSGDRPTFHYRFGGDSVPFSEALKEQSDSLQFPWLWADLKANYPGTQNVINSLSSEGRYEFTLTGKFEDVTGTDVQITWDEVPFSSRSRRSASQGQTHPRDTALPSGTSEPTVGDVDAKVKDVVAKERPGDPPGIFPSPPRVELDPDLKLDNHLDLPLDGN